MSDLDKYRDLLNQGENGPDDELSEFLRNSTQTKVPAGKNKEAIWSKISEAIDKDDAEQKDPVPIWKYVGIAASIALITFFSFKLFENPGDISDQTASITLIDTKSAETKIDTLPDGSRVILNAASSVAYHKNWDRKVSLIGEAFFEVVKGEKFLVETEFGDVQVLGTSFNVFARNGNLEVACKTGKVKVTVPGRMIAEELIPGKYIAIEADTVRREARVPESIGKWKSGEFYFENKPISHVFAEFERQFNVEIEYDANESDAMLFTGYFRNDRDMESALETVCVVMDLKYQKTGQNTFIIRGNKQ